MMAGSSWSRMCCPAWVHPKKVPSETATTFVRSASRLLHGKEGIDGPYQTIDLVVVFCSGRHDDTEDGAYRGGYWLLGYRTGRTGALAIHQRSWSGDRLSERAVVD